MKANITLINFIISVLDSDTGISRESYEILVTLLKQYNLYFITNYVKCTDNFYYIKSSTTDLLTEEITKYLA